MQAPAPSRQQQGRQHFELRTRGVLEPVACVAESGDGSRSADGERDNAEVIRAVS